MGTARSLLGSADVSDERLADFVSAQVDAPARVLTCEVAVVDYDLQAITTGGRWWVEGQADVDGSEVDYRFFVKLVHSWDHSPLFAQARHSIPPELLAWAIASVPWRNEPLAYGSDLGSRLPEGLTMPRAYAAEFIGDGSAMLWLEPVAAEPVVWDSDRYGAAAYLLGRLAASRAVADLGELSERPFHVQDYASGRVAHQVVPTLRDHDVWHHPLAAPFADVRGRLLGAADRVEAYAAEADGYPRLNAHGDACPNNLLVVAGRPGFVLIDYALWQQMPVGFDLAQLLVGDVQIGRRSADDLAEMHGAILPPYVEGLRAEGCDIPEHVVRRAHALCLLLFTGLSSLPMEHLGAEPTPALVDLARTRAQIARFALDQVDATA